MSQPRQTFLARLGRVSRKKFVSKFVSLWEKSPFVVNYLLALLENELKPDPLPVHEIFSTLQLSTVKKFQFHVQKVAIYTLATRLVQENGLRFLSTQDSKALLDRIAFAIASTDDKILNVQDVSRFSERLTELNRDLTKHARRMHEAYDLLLHSYKALYRMTQPSTEHVPTQPAASPPPPSEPLTQPAASPPPPTPPPMPPSEIPKPPPPPPSFKAPSIPPPQMPDSGTFPAPPVLPPLPTQFKKSYPTPPPAHSIPPPPMPDSGTFPPPPHPPSKTTPPPADPESSSWLADIRKGGLSQLKPVPEESDAVPEESSMESNPALKKALKTRRAAVEGHDADSSEDDDAWVEAQWSQHQQSMAFCHMINERVQTWTKLFEINKLK